MVSVGLCAPYDALGEPISAVYNELMNWETQQAGENLEQILAPALDYGPQILTANGKEVAVFVAFDEWRRLTAKFGQVCSKKSA